MRKASHLLATPHACELSGTTVAAASEVRFPDMRSKLLGSTLNQPLQ